MEQHEDLQKPYNLEPNKEAVLAYLLGPITGTMVYMLEKDNQFVKFHALQAILFGVLVLVALLVVSAIPLLNLLLTPLVALASAITWMITMLKAYNNELFELPILGKFVHALEK